MSYPVRNTTSRPILDRKAVNSRLGLFVGGRYASTNLSSVLYRDKRDDDQHISMQMWSAPGSSKPTFDEAKTKLDSGAGKDVRCGVRFGPSWTNHWLKVTLDIPSSWSDAESVELHFDPSCEAMIFDAEGLALQGITGGFDYNRRVEYILPTEEVKSGKAVRYIEVSANGVFGMQPSDYGKEDKYYTLAQMGIVSVNLEARQLEWDFDTLSQLAETLPEHSPMANRARSVANRIMNTFDGTQGSITKCRELATEVLGEGWEEEYAIAKDAKDVNQDGTLWAIGYCHIDTAWLWPWKATQQKIARSWTSQLDLMDRYPEYRFMVTAAQHFSWLEELYPKVFERVQEKVKSGQFEVNGACWLEMDANMPTGESFCRQLLYGQGYFQSRFGKRSDVLILPDTFGFSPALPQIARLGGCTSYFTHKMNWNQINVFPFTTFNWVGIDGTQLLSHLTPILRYDSLCTVDEIVRAYPNHKNLDVSRDAVLPFGHGDGGGGPKPLMMERLRRARAVGKQSGGQAEEMPLVKQGATMSEFFDHVRKTTKDGARLPVWAGELYLEMHRGTLTSQSNTKQNFRKSEIALREVELFSTLASIHVGFAYPKERIDKTWQKLCLCMFHDTLPGSSIRLAVEDYDKAFAAILESAEEMKQSALRALQKSGNSKSSSAYLNTLPGFCRLEVVQTGHQDYKVVDLAVGDVIADARNMTAAETATANELDDGSFEISNSCLKIKLYEGRISSVFDIRDRRELIAENSTAGFLLFRDETFGGQAWDFEQYDLENFKDINLSSIRVTSSSGLRAELEGQLQFGRSTGTVKISLDALSASSKADARSMLRFDCHMDWHERNKFLKFNLPLSLFSDHATYDTAFGVHRRPTTRNNSFEAAKWEVAAHKFADYSEHGYGVAIINDCKYGYAAQGNQLTLSLLRGPTEPDGEADQGTHDFSFAVYPHVGTYAESDVQTVAHCFNNPLQRIPHELTKEARRMPFCIEGARNVMLEGIKRAEENFDPFTFVEQKKGSKSVILRIHEHMGGHASCKLIVKGLSVEKAELVNVLEDRIAEIDVATDMDREIIDLDFRGFEVKSVKLTLH